MTRFLVTLRNAKDRAVAVRAAERAPEGYTVEIREAKRSDDQNRALWGLLNQIQRQRPTHNGVSMTPELWKSVFMDALGAEMRMMPKLDGDGFFPMGHSTSRLTKGEFTDLLELMLAWTAREGLTVEHFNDGRDAAGGGESSKPAARAA